MSKTLAESVPAELRAELARQRMTQQQLADALGVHNVWVSRRLLGHTAITISDLERIAAVLGIEPSAFLMAIPRQRAS